MRLYSDRIDIVKRAEAIFVKEKESIRDQERTKRVAALLKKNKKFEQQLSKRDIADALNIPEREMYKYLSKGS